MTINAKLGTTLRMLMHVIRKTTVFVLVSGATGLWLVNSTFYWDFITWLPWRLVKPLDEVIYFITKPILFSDVHNAEGQLEFFQAWFLCSLALAFALVIFRLMRKRLTSSPQTDRTSS